MDKLDKSTAPVGTTHAFVDFDGKLIKWLTLKDDEYFFLNGTVMAVIARSTMQGHGKIVQV